MLVVSIIMFIVAIILFIIWYFSYYKKSKIRYEEYIKTIGEVDRYSGNQMGMDLPIVQYKVGDTIYEAIGPKFRGIIMSYGSKDKPNKRTNLTTRENLPEYLETYNYDPYASSPLYDLYNIGDIVDVYYDPNDPSKAYVQRFLRPSEWLHILLIISIIVLILGVYFLLFL